MMKIFDQKPFAIVKQGLDHSYAEHRNITDNIANADTPGYRARHLEFRRALQEAADGGESMKLKVTDPGHISRAPGGGAPPHTRVQAGVSVDEEMAELAKNSIMYNTYIEIMNRKQEQLKTILREVR